MPRKIGLGGGLGARYGTIARRQYVEILTGLRSKHECPRCKFNTVKRSSVGIWNCHKCGFKFAGGAYTPTTKLGEIAARATRGMMSPSTLSTELDSLRAGAKVAQSTLPPVRRTRTRRRKTPSPSETNVTMNVGEKGERQEKTRKDREEEESTAATENVETRTEVSTEQEETAEDNE